MATKRFQSALLPAVDGAPTEGGGGPSVHLVTFGCQMNKYDSLMVEGRFRKQGYRITSSLDDADVVLFNTCSVRDHAEERVYSWLGELKHAKNSRPDLVIGVLGCMAQRAQDEIFSRAGHVDLVVGTRRFQHLPNLVNEVLERRADPDAGDGRLLDVGMDEDVVVDRSGEPYTGGLAGFLAVMRGCDLNCTYCIVPATRGRVRSLPIGALVDEAKWMVDSGAKVITLLGQTVNSYGEDLPKPGPGELSMRGRQGRPSLADLMYELEEIDGLERLRLITLHPSYLTRELAEALRDCSKADRFLPLPAQSGSDDVLRRMKRGYTTDLYRRRLDMLREIVPDVEVGTDWIVGFPGETDEDFAATEAFCEEIGFAQNYVFKYDPRPTTKAEVEMPDDVPTAVKKERNSRLLRVAERSQFARMSAQVGSEVDVFVDRESERYPGWVQGRSTHTLHVSFEWPAEAGPIADAIGRMHRVRVGEASPFGLHGSLVH
ncbi:tRNA-2-methylthio-N(6)-dimethylallyladenosine synthase [Planctomycetes bacterium Pla163]|jgi:tRNA-2-methylthio-N6-dimethylallyladenosine synthase|uniref:tRNA-2-methylthio-N(6)-dimethylallyladenosine synthase n=1 Tax=Rohdeia mirabilis TaxID=2528008 RepID=A0A518D153_9BACT|nr:tRNA-2-methylthio-N(6)-dimethylallyladenosine synthase [Planctomycetes bacterium Pla163]